VSPLLLRYGPYALALMAIVGLGWWGGWHFGSSYWKTRYAAEIAQAWQAKARGEEAARQALERQLATSQATIIRNSEALHEYRAKLDIIDTERDRIGAQLRRVLATAPRSCPPGDSMPPATDRSGVDASSGDDGNGRLPELASAVVAECRRNNARLDAIVEQLTPQLRNR
jgi:hypothetical protein